MKSERVSPDVLNRRTELLLINVLYRPSIRQNASTWALSSARLCLAAAIVLIPLRYRIAQVARPIQSISNGFTDFVLFPADVAVLLMLGLWLISLAISPHRPSFGPRYVWIPLAGLTLAGWTSTIFSYDPFLSVYHAIRFTVLFWFYVFIVNEIHFLGWVLIPVGLQVLAQSMIALAEFVSQRSVHLQPIGELYLDPARSGVSIVAANGSRLLRSYGLTDHPNILGGCLAFGLVLILAAFLHAHMRPGAIVILLSGGAALLVTFSRSAWLALFAGSMVLIIAEFMNRRRESIRALLWLGLAGVLVVTPFVLAYPQFFGVRLNAGNSFSTPSVEQQSIGERLLLIGSYSAILSDHPLLGVGLGAAPLALMGHEPAFPVNPEPPHWALLDAAVETGLPGSAFYLTLVIAPFVIYFVQRGSILSNPLATATLALLLSISVVGLFDHYTWTLAPGRLWQWLAWGLWALVSNPAAALADGKPLSPAPEHSLSL